MVHRIQLALGAFMSSLGVEECTKSWEAREQDQQFEENEITDIGKSQRFRKEGNARINMVLVMRPSFEMIIEQVFIARHFEITETDLDIAANDCCTDHTDSVLSKRVH